ALMFRIPRDSFHLPGIGEQLTTENLLRAVAIGAEEVESWREGGVSHSGLDGSNPELRNPLPQPPPEATHLEIYVRLKPPPQVVVRDEGPELEIASPRWQELEARWKAILGLEATIDTLRISMEGLRTELEGEWNRMLRTEEKQHALAAD